MPDLKSILEFEPDAWDPSESIDVTENTVAQVAAAWIQYHNSFWAWETAQQALWEMAPVECWRLIQGLVEGASDGALGAIGAGPLEDLLEAHGNEVITDIEIEAAGSQPLRVCISYVWRGGMPDELWQRLVRARQDEPQRG